jgi:hypothetical protein
LDLIKGLAATIISIFRFDYKETPIGTILFDFVFNLPVALFYLSAIILATPIVLVICGMMSLVETTTVPPGASHVPPHYTPTTGDVVPGVVFATFGAIFGGIHLIGWNFTYPTLIEQMVWRVSALLITVIPSYLIFCEHLARYSWGFEPHTPEAQQLEIRGFGPKLVLFLVLIALFLIIVYVFARLTLVVQSFVLMRKQPASAFCSVDWTLFFPHLS